MFPEKHISERLVSEKTGVERALNILNDAQIISAFPPSCNGDFININVLFMFLISLAVTFEAPIMYPTPFNRKQNDL